MKLYQKNLLEKCLTYMGKANINGQLNKTVSNRYLYFFTPQFNLILSKNDLLDLFNSNFKKNLISISKTLI